jgi:hypothetical protein
MELIKQPFLKFRQASNYHHYQGESMCKSVAKLCSIHITTPSTFTLLKLSQPINSRNGKVITVAQYFSIRYANVKSFIIVSKVVNLMSFFLSFLHSLNLNKKKKNTNK